MIKRIALGLGAALLLACPVVLAFPYPYSWHTSATSGPPAGKPGSGGTYATGSVRDKGITCAHCHIKAAGTIGVTITPSPAWSKVGAADAYSPGTTYMMTVSLTGEHKLPTKPGMKTTNGMNLTVEDAGGNTVGVFTADSGVSSASCPPTWPKGTTITGTTYTYGDCHGVVSLEVANNTTWKFSWTAPAAGTGDATVYYGVVDGDTGGDSSLDDDVKVGTKLLKEGP